MVGKMAEKRHFFFTKIQSPVSGVEKWGKIEVSGGLRKIGDFIGLLWRPWTPEGDTFGT